MKMVKGLCHKRLPDIIITTRHQVDVLAIPGLLFVESFLQKNLNPMAEVLLQQAVLLGGYHCCIDRLPKVVVHHLLSGRFVLAFEDIFELFKGVCPVEVNLFGPLIEIGDCFVDGEFNAKLTTVDMDLSFQFIEARVLVLHFVHLLGEIFLVKRLLEKSQRWFLVIRCHLKFSRQ